LKTKGPLTPANFRLDFPSVGATENLMMTASLVEGKTVLKNVAREPEIIALADFLNKGGAKIKGAGSPTITITGVKELNSVKYSIIPDRIETATFVMAAATTRSDITLKNIDKTQIPDLIEVMEKTKIKHEFPQNDILKIYASKSQPVPITIKTGPYPAFSTDMQPLLMSFLTTVPVKSVITETIFENRFMHVMELNRMDANIDIEGNKAIVNGSNKKLSGAEVKSTDLRGGAALIIAALSAEGTSVIAGMQHVNRGYENIVKKFKKLGAKIEHHE